MGTFSIWHWLIVLVVVMLVFGTKKISTIGSDLGKAVKGFKEGMKDEEEKPLAAASVPSRMPDKDMANVEAKVKSAG